MRYKRKKTTLVEMVQVQVRKMIADTSINGMFSQIPNASKPSGLIWGNDLIKWLKKYERNK